MKAKRTWWTAEQIALLVRLYPDELTADLAKRVGRSQLSCYNKAHSLGLVKTEAFRASDKSARIQRGKQHPNMIASRFQRGLVPWNKGKPHPSHENSRKHQFKPGQKPSGWVPVGSYRVNSYGILDRKITDLGRGPRDWEPVHRLVWIDANGPIPHGHVIAFKPGRKTAVLEQITADAVECISRGELAWRNHACNRSPELFKLVQLKGAITRQVNRINREQEQRA